MVKLIIKWVIFALVITGTCYLPGISVESFGYAMLIAAVLTLINIFIKPVIKFFTLPVNLLTFGLFNLVINYGLLYLAAFFIKEYRLDNPLSAFIASIVIAASYCILKH